MADEGNEDSWLYESSANAQETEIENADKVIENPKPDLSSKIDEPEVTETPIDDEVEEFLEPVDGMEEENSVDKKGGDDSGDDSDDSDDDDINVVIGDIKSGPSYNLKPRAQILSTAAAATEKTKIPTGKFSIEEFESVGIINGQAAHEFALEMIEEKPWRKPGADITDYFNYGFNEDTWRAYCERQKKMRVHESGIGLSSLSANVQPTHNQSHSNNAIAGGRPGPPGRNRITSIDVIGSAHNRDRDMGGYGHHSYNGPPPGKSNNPKENVIQVMTADRREYSRTVTGNKFDSAMPPPFEQELLPDPFFTGEDPFAYGYEPTQDSQWDPSQAPAPAWAPTGIKELTGSHIQMMPSHGGMMVPPHNLPQMMGGPPMGGHPMMPPVGGMPSRGMDRNDRSRGEKEVKEDLSRDRDDKDRDRSRSSRSDKHRERDRRRDRSRSRESTVRDSKRSRSREKSRRRSKSHDKKSKEKKKSSRKDREDSE